VGQGHLIPKAPLHASIARSLREAILRGELQQGGPLPSEAQLCRRYGASRGTVRQALAALRAEGLICGGRGRVPTVGRPGLAQSFDQLVSFSAWARTLGRRPGARTLELARRPADAQTAAALGVAAGAPIYAYLRVRLLDGVAVMVERTTLVEDVGRLLADFDLDEGSVYEQLAARGVELREADQTISAVAAGAQDAELLSVARRAPLLQVRRRAFDASGRALEWAEDRYRGDAFAITVHSHSQARRSGVALLSAAGEPDPVRMRR
jgi:GntR family transcriptional regulator